MIFVDTSAWYAQYTPRDAYHRSAAEFHLQNSEPLLTTDYVIDESLTLLKARGNYERARHFGERVFNGTLATLVWIEPDNVEAAWKVFHSFRDKQWSFTDCTSYVVLQRLGIETAFALTTIFGNLGRLGLCRQRASVDSFTGPALGPCGTSA